MRLRSFCLVAIAVATASYVAPSAALAVPPPNDDFNSATVISSIPFTDSLSTVEATTAIDDPNCSGRGHTVWYSFTPTTTGLIDANTFGSSYDTTISVYTGSRGSLTQVACDDDTFGNQSQVVFEATSGVTYHIMAGAFGTRAGGNLELTVQEPPPPPEPPTFTATNPPSPANENSPRIIGTAAEGSTVRLYRDPSCTGSVAAVGTAAAFASPGLRVFVSDNSTTTFYATASVGVSTSPCSTDSITYVEITPPPPVNISPAGENASNPQVAIDADGDALAVWQNTTNGRIQARARSATGTFGPVQTLSALFPDTPPIDPQVAVDADGDALVVWERPLQNGRQVIGRARTAAGTLGPVQAFSAPGQDAVDPQVAIDAEGDALVVWEIKIGSTFRIQARARSATGALGPIQVFSGAVGNAFDPQVAIDADGDAYAVWRHFDGANWRIEGRARSAGGVVGPVQRLSDAGRNAFDAQVAIDADGDAYAVWRRFDGSDFRIEGRARSATGTLGAVDTLSDAGQNALQPQVAIDADGDALAVWRRYDETSATCCRLIDARARSAAGVLGPVQTLSGGGHDSYDPQVGMDAAGDAVAVWRSFVNRGNRIEFRTRSAAGELGPALAVSSPNSFKPQVAVAADGDALAVWERFDGTNRRIQAFAIAP